MILRLPVSVTSSVALHGAILAFIANPGAVPKPSVVLIGNVDLLVPAPRRPAAAAAAPSKPPSTLDFLKMALPSLPKIIAPIRPAALDVKLPEISRTRPLVPEPKLEERERLKAAPKIAALDLGKKRVEAARVEAAPIESRKSMGALLEAPRLEEVGRRQVANLPAAIALEERRREAVDMKRMEAMTPEFPASRKAPTQAMAVLREATPQERARLGDRLETLGPHPGLQLAPERARPQEVPAIARKVPAVEPVPERRQAKVDLAQAPKQGVEIEGPLKNRRVVYYELPEFPDWARDHGLMEASVAIRFTVSRDGDVLPGMRVEQTSGYGRLDRLAMEALKKWRFAPGGAEERQWGVITFRFVLE